MKINLQRSKEKSFIIFRIEYAFLKTSIIHCFHKKTKKKGKMNEHITLTIEISFEIIISLHL